jgi:hypothetical protein
MARSGSWRTVSNPLNKCLLNRLDHPRFKSMEFALQNLGVLGRISFGAVALISAGIGVHSVNLRELYHEMYPLEVVKREAFHICNETNPTFVRAVGADREACYNSMPHIMAVAMGRVHPASALSVAAMTDPSREAELLMELAATPPRQPITEPRSFANTAWMRALSPPCDAKNPLPAISDGTADGVPAPGSDGAAAIGGVIQNKLPLPSAVAARTAHSDPLPVISLTERNAGAPPASATGGQAAASDSLTVPDVGDHGPPAIVPLAPATSCGGA